ncbi:TlpA family protein disulfide reductase [Pedobacter sp. KLB.chiD]|uniref:TlpA family protein disulfide reductase n=1 Tax=Pedobacter sp. KLB.chiD TaxID=3387402 RepID=UPI00399A2271
MKKLMMILSLALSYLLGCSNDTSIRNDVKDTEKLKQVVIVVFKNPLMKKPKKGEFYTQNKISYYDDDMMLKENDLGNRSGNDTILLASKRQFIAVDLFSSYVNYNYHFRNGDTIFINFRKNIPLATDTKNLPHYDLNYSLEYKKRYLKPLISSGMLTMSKDILSSESKFSFIKSDYVNQKKFIDSLEQNNKLSPVIASFFRNQNNFEFYSHGILDDSYSKYFNAFPEKSDSINILNDKRYFYNGYFHNFLIWKYLWSSKSGINRIQRGSRISPDYKQVYQLSRKLFPDTSLRYAMLRYSLQMVQEQEPKDVFKLYKQKFKEDVPESFYQNYLADNPMVEISTKSGSSLLISKMSSKKIEFSELIKSLPGQVLYVDLWASWCVPCRASMPASRLLKKTFSNKKIKFIYLSIDEKLSSWEKASIEEGLNSDAYNFLLINPKESSILKQINLKTIPRYLLFDKTGKLVYENAPNPGSSELIGIINKYL